MTALVSINGTICPSAEARVSVFDRGFLYGDSVFEVLRTYDARPFALESHLRRLERSAALVAMDLPVPAAQLSREISDVLAAAGNPESYVRIIVTRGSGELGLDPAHARDPLRVIIVQPLAAQPDELYLRGVAVITVVSSRGADSAAGAKSSNYLGNLLATRDAKQRGAHEAFMITPAGTVLEGASSTIFTVRHARLATPPLSAGILAGITREHVLEAAQRAGVPADEREIPVSELRAADEVFLTSTLRELVPVVRIDDRVVGEGTPGPITRRLHRAFRELTPASARPLPWEH